MYNVLCINHKNTTICKKYMNMNNKITNYNIKKTHKINNVSTSSSSSIESFTHTYNISRAETKTRMDSVLAIILGGGSGTRLYPLTKDRAKPAVPLGGSYRLIDIVISNCINSDINKIYCLTQFNSSSLNKHLGNTHRQLTNNYNENEFIEILAAHQTPRKKNNWFEGTADAIRKYSWLIQEEIDKGIENIIILSGDQLYLMDYELFFLHHIQQNADITIACTPVTKNQAKSLGILKTDENYNVKSFSEKPSESELLKLKNN